MKIYEFGPQHDRTFVMFPCAAEPWWVFKASAEEMAKDYHVYLFIADGHDGLGTEFVSLEKYAKDGFEILDFRGATQLFEKGFDDDVEPEDYSDRTKDGESDDGKDGGMKDDDKPKPTPTDKHKKYHVDGHDIKIVHEVVLFLGEDGKTLFTERLSDFTRKAIKKHYPTLDAFRGAWAQADKKQAILDELAENNVLLDAVREENPDLADCDYFDIICHVAFDQKPLTRKERIDGVKKRNYLA